MHTAIWGLGIEPWSSDEQIVLTPEPSLQSPSQAQFLMEVGFLLPGFPAAVHIAHTFKMPYLHLDCGGPSQPSVGCIPKDS